MTLHWQSGIVLKINCVDDILTETGFKDRDLHANQLCSNSEGESSNLHKRKQEHEHVHLSPVQTPSNFTPRNELDFLATYSRYNRYTPKLLIP